MAEKVGQGSCLACGELIPFKETAGGALSVNCPWCDFSGYAKGGTQAQKILRGRMHGGAAVAEVQETRPALKDVAPKVPVAQVPKKPASMAGLLIG